QELLMKAIKEDAVELLKPGLEFARSSKRVPFPVRVGSLMRAAVDAKSHAVLTYLLDYEDAQPSEILVSRISQYGSIGLFEILLAHGWDIDSQDRDGRRFVDHSCHDETLVRWLVQRGAVVDNGKQEEDPGSEIVPPRPVLQTCAARGSLSTFKFLQSQGAKLGRRSLHLAAQVGARNSADPGNNCQNSRPWEIAREDDSDEVKKDRADSEDILRYLLDDLGLDVNSLDTDILKGVFYSGTAINYASWQNRSTLVVQWLLQRGADPTIRS
ncbi:hypothetical protein K504DRAFT_363610, partial [Pleomassaria siparia CBS 279.74]